MVDRLRGGSKLGFGKKDRKRGRVWSQEFGIALWRRGFDDEEVCAFEGF